MRGKAEEGDILTAEDGITPAHAGKSQPKKPVTSLIKDHPRACGEKKIQNTDFFGYRGSPPRMRGKGFAGES